MSKLYVFQCLALLFSCVAVAQIKGKITDDFGVSFAGVNIYIPDSPHGTTSNEQGVYLLDVNKPGSYTVHFQFIGYKSQTRTITYTGQPLELNVMMPEEQFELNEVVITKGEDPAYPIIREAIKSRVENSKRLQYFAADFYSRGSFKLVDTPKSFMGEKIDYSDMLLDSTGTGLVYLSETLSKIHYNNPVMREQVTASKVAGNDRGYSFNTALAANFSFYEPTVKINVPVISPIASNALMYYTYKFEGSFVDDFQHTINKIKVTPKRSNEAAVAGYIYIVDDSWAIYGLDFTIDGRNLALPGAKDVVLQQNFTFHPQEHVWVKATQVFSAKLEIFAFKIEGAFHYVYSNYDLNAQKTELWKKNELISVLKDSNKKDTTFWSQARKVPLSEEEIHNYHKQDSVQVVRTSPAYLDSVQKERNRFGFSNLTGYTYTNYHSKWRAGYQLLKGISFNAVQGFVIAPELTYEKLNEDNMRTWSVLAKVNYGFSEERLRFSGGFQSRYNSQNRQNWSLMGGTDLRQFNPNEPISPLVNVVASLFFKDNYIKLYERNFAEASYYRELFNGFYAGLKLSYEDRKPVTLHSDYSVIKNDDLYQSNNPLDDSDYSSAGFEAHQQLTATWMFNIRFGQKIMTRPDYVSRIANTDYPEFTFYLINSVWASDSRYSFTRYELQMKYGLDFGAYGKLDTQSLLGDFDAKEGLGFMDYKHFLGNQTHVDLSGRMNTFGLLPYYTRSTMNAYGETHWVYNDLGFITNKLPLIKLLRSHFNAEYHLSAVESSSPYHEFHVGLSNLGLGIFKQFKVQYVYAVSGNVSESGVLFGFKMGL